MSVSPELSPSLLAKYQIIGEISRGGMGVVFKALHKEMQKLVAIKVILTQMPDLKDVQRFEREALALAQLRHPNIVRVLEFSGFSSQSPAYIVLEYVDGITFDRWVKESIHTTGAVPPLEESAGILETLAATLSYCHSKGIAHRDLKPVNIVIENGTGRPVLLDFGLVKVEATEFGRGPLELESPLTATGEILGTPAFMAPEQIDATGRFGRLGLPCDVWGMGGLLYFAITGSPPHRGENLVEIFGDILNAEVLPPSSLVPTVPGWAEQLCVDCLVRDSQYRLDMDGVVAALKIRREALPPEPQERGKRSRWLLALSVVIVLVLGMSLAVFFRTEAKPDMSFDQGLTRRTRQRTVVLRGTVGDATHIEFRVKIRGRTKKRKISVEGKQRFELSLNLENEEEHRISARAINGEESSAVKHWTLALDLTPPSVSYSFKGSTYETPVTIECQSDEKVAFYVVDGKKVLGDRFGAIQHPLKIGKNVLKIKAVDDLGNVSPVKRLVIKRRPMFVVSIASKLEHRFFNMPGVPFYQDLRAAVRDAGDNTKIAIFPGSYEAGITLVRPLILEGVGDRDSIHITSPDQLIVLGVNSTRAELRNLKIDSMMSLVGMRPKEVLDKTSAIMINESQVLMENCHVTRTHSGVGAGSIRVQKALAARGIVTIRNCLFDYCRQTAVGAQSGVRMIIEDCRFINNGAGMIGNAVYVNRAGTRVKNCYFESNAVGVMTRSTSDVVIENSKFLKNSKALRHFSKSDVVCKNTRFEKNGLAGGEQVHLAESNIRLTNCQFIEGINNGLRGSEGGLARFDSCLFQGQKGCAAVFDPGTAGPVLKAEFRDCIFDDEGVRGPWKALELYVVKRENRIDQILIKACVFKRDGSLIILPTKKKLKFVPHPASKKLKIIETIPK